MHHQTTTNRYTAMMNIDYITTELAELAEAQAELADLQAMSEEEACKVYNVDSKAEAENRLNEIIAMLETDTKNLAPDDDTDTAIEIFGSYAAMNAFLY